MRPFLLIAFLFLALAARAQMISGTITDPAGRGIPFASVYIKGSTTGTSANNEGEYRLRLTGGSGELVFSAIGYRQQVRAAEPGAGGTLDVTLTPEIYTMKDVVIREGGEDPAYEIIRRAIRKRKDHLQEVSSYSADVYIKGLQRLLEAPRKFLGRDVEKTTRSMGLDSNRTGILYLSESRSKLSYLRPDRYREEMVASRVSGNNQAFSFNRATDLMVNLYENYSRWEGLTTRPLISPIADQALFYYRYLLLGTTVENGVLINKIQVIPRRNSDPVFRGIIYILEDSWRIHSADLSVRKEAGINFVDNLRIFQSFYPAGGQTWMPNTVRLDFTGGLFGFRFSGYYMAVYSNYDLAPGLDKRDFAETLRITRDVGKKDTGYWDQVRPVPLTAEEEADYLKKEALAARRDSRAYLDSADREYNRFRPLRFIAGSGHHYRNRARNESYHFSSLLNSVFYNTVEGWGLNYRVSYVKRTDTLLNRQLRLAATARYGASAGKLHAHVQGSVPAGDHVIGFQAGSDVTDINDLGTISQLGNTINSLLYERNYLKLYQTNFAGISLSSRLAGGLRGQAALDWADRKALVNTTDYRWRDDPGSDFTSNNPFVPGSDVPLFPRNQALTFRGRLTYDFSNAYVTYPTGRYYVPSRYPKVGLSYTRGISGILGSDVDLELLEMDVSRSGIPLGMYGKTDFHVAAGMFLNRGRLFYTDMRHFAGNQTRAFEPRANGFLLLPYYTFSIDDKFLEAHLRHDFSGFILNKVPLLRKLRLREIVAFNYLANPLLPDYKEAAIGLEHMFGLQVLYAVSFTGGNRTASGIKIAYGFGR